MITGTAFFILAVDLCSFTRLYIPATIGLDNTTASIPSLLLFRFTPTAASISIEYRYPMNMSRSFPSMLLLSLEAAKCISPMEQYLTIVIARVPSKAVSR